MSIEQLKNNLPAHAKDIKLNLSSVLSVEGAPDLSQKQIDTIALAIAYALKDSTLQQALLNQVSDNLSEAEMAAAKAAATIMAMNNIYYRFVHMVSDKQFSTLPAKLRMNVLANPGIDKIDFELASLAVSAINGCGMCIDAHTAELKKADVSPVAIQSAVRIAAVLNATSTALQ